MRGIGSRATKLAKKANASLLSPHESTQPSLINKAQPQLIGIRRMLEDHTRQGLASEPHHLWISVLKEPH